MDAEVLYQTLENLPGMYITKRVVHDVTHRKIYYRYELLNFKGLLLTFESDVAWPKDRAKDRLLYTYNKIATEMLEIYNSPAWDTLKEYNDTLKAIDNL